MVITTNTLGQIDRGRGEEAIPLLCSAILNWKESGAPFSSLKCEACLGLALLAQGESGRSETKTLADRGWAAYGQGDMVGEELQTWLWTLARLHRALGRDDRADTLVGAAYREIQRQARAIADHDTRARFFREGPNNRAIVDAYDRLAGVTRRQQVSLARAGAPRERVTVIWTVSGPEDEAVEDKAERRGVFWGRRKTRRRRPRIRSWPSRWASAAAR
jgi:hypothetical protein